MIGDCKANGAFNPVTMGSVPSVGLMAQAAEEYGSHNKTFVIPAAGTVRVTDASGRCCWSRPSRPATCGACARPGRRRAGLGQAGRHPRPRHQDPGRVLAGREPRPRRAVIAKVKQYLNDHDTSGLDLRILDPVEATKFSLKRIRAGQDTISVTGNVLRDYLTDLFPIMELGTSAKMLSIVPLMAGGEAVRDRRRRFRA